MKIISTRGLSKQDKQYLKEAIGLADCADARDNGWKYLGQGAFKAAFRKGNIVVKFSHFEKRDSEHMRDEIRVFKKLKQADKKYFARIFAYDSTKIIQAYVKGPRVRGGKNIDKLYSIGEKYGLTDIDHNAKMVNNIPIFFDFGM